MSLPGSIISQRRSRCRYCLTPCADFEADHVRIDDAAYKCPQDRWPVSQAAQAEPVLPNIGRLTLNFGKAVIAEATAIAMGVAPITEAEARRRLTICQSCPHYRASDDRCSACGCYLKSKSTWRSQSCPRGRW